MKDEIIEEFSVANAADNNNNNDDDCEPRRYEIGYLLTPMIAAPQVAQTVETLIRGTIVTAGGKIIGSEEPKLISLPYPIRKTVDNKNLRFKEAYFASLHFSVLPDQVAALDQVFRFSPVLLRFLIVELPTRIEESRRRPREVVPLPTVNNAPKDGESAVPAMSQADMDREIDELLGVVPQL